MTGIRRVSQLGTTGVSTFVDGSVVLGTDTTGNYVSTVVAGTAIGISGATGNVTVTNSGVTSAVAGTGVSVSSGTGAVTISIGQSVGTGDSPTFAKVYLTTPTSGLTVGQVYTATWGGIAGNRGYLLLNNSASDGNIYLRSSSDSNVYIGGNNSNTLLVGNGFATVNGAFTISSTLAVAGATTTLGYVASGATGVTDVGSVSATGWFRSTGATGWYNQTYGGGIYMEDSTYVRVYGSKRFYASAGLHTGIQYGSYGSMSVWSKNNGWAGINFPENAVTWMQLDDSQFGVYRQNSTWNFYYYYGSFTASDSRYKREIKPLEYGLNLINALKPVEFKRLTERNDDDPEAVEEEIFYGFLAQDIKEALDSVGETRDTNLWDLGGPEMPLTPSDRQYINEIELVPPIVKALQELDARLKLLEGGI
jgi:hypothetical protein